jgi:hypothetical protein
MSKRKDGSGASYHLPTRGGKPSSESPAVGAKRLRQDPPRGLQQAPRNPLQRQSWGASQFPETASGRFPRILARRNGEPCSTQYLPQLLAQRGPRTTAARRVPLENLTPAAIQDTYGRLQDGLADYSVLQMHRTLSRHLPR